MNKPRKTKQNVQRHKKNKSKERKIVENYHKNLHSQSFPPPKTTKPVKSAPTSPNPATNQWKADYVNRITCPARKNFYEPTSPNVTNVTNVTNVMRKRTIATSAPHPQPPPPPQNMRRVFPLIEGDKNFYKQKRNAKGVYFAKVEKTDSPMNQAKYNTWKVKKVENRAMNTKPQIMSTYARHQQREEEKRRRAFQGDVVRRGALLPVHTQNSLIETVGDPHHYRNLTVTEVMHVDIKPIYNLTNSPFRHRSPMKSYTLGSERSVY